MIFVLLFLLFGGLILTPKTVLGLPILLSDDFNDGNQLDGNPAYWEEIFSNNNWFIENGKYIGTTAVPSTASNSRTLAGDLSWSNYAVEATLKSISGVDRHLLFRFDQNRPIPRGYAIKYRDAEYGFSGHIELQKAGLEVVSSNGTFKSKLGDTHRLRVEGIDNHIKVFVDGQKYIDYVDNNSPILSGKIGLLIENSGSGLTNITEYDDVFVEQISSFSDEVPTLTSTPTPTIAPTPTPTASPTIAPTPTVEPTIAPTPSPTLSPTPTPVSHILSVSDIKQYSSPWGDQIYDSATNWTSNPTIDRWGCALTSASMVLKYWGHNINPDELNTWLKNQADGYVGNGLLNWLAVTRYTKQHDSQTTPTLEYRRLPGTLENISTEVDNGRPSILKLPGHFVVGKGYADGGNYYINDPATTQPTLSYYGNSYLALNQFKPSHTDLSYILLTINPGYTISVFNSSGNPVGESYLEEPLLDQVDGVSTSGDSLGVYMLPIPDDGIYRVEVTGPAGEYVLNSYVYNTAGDVDIQTFNGIAGTDQKDLVQVDVTGDTSTTTRKVTIVDILNDWNNAYSQGFIKNRTFYRSVKSLLLTAKKYINKKKYTQAKSVLVLARGEIVRQTPAFIDTQTSGIIVSELDSLISSL